MGEDASLICLCACEKYSHLHVCMLFVDCVDIGINPVT